LLAGRRLVGVKRLFAEICDRRVAFPVGATCLGVRRRAKKVILDFSDGSSLLISLGMTGQVRERERGPLPPHTHLVLSFEGREVIYVDPRRLGRLAASGAATTMWAARGDVNAWCDRQFGPDALDVPWEEFRRRLGASRGCIKTLLLNQKVLAGIGNIYADEALFRAGVHPRTPARDVPLEKLKKLYQALRGILRQSINASGTTLRDYVTSAGAPGDFARRLKVYGREGAACPRCGTPVRRLRWPAGRSSFYCPRCQRER